LHNGLGLETVKKLFLLRQKCRKSGAARQQVVAAVMAVVAAEVAQKQQAVAVGL